MDKNLRFNGNQIYFTKQLNKTKLIEDHQWGDMNSCVVRVHGINRILWKTESLYKCDSRDLIGLAALVNEPSHHAHFRVDLNLIVKARLSDSYCDLPAPARKRSASAFIYLFTLKDKTHGVSTIGHKIPCGSTSKWSVDVTAKRVGTSILHWTTEANSIYTKTIQKYEQKRVWHWQINKNTMIGK